MVSRCRFSARWSRTFLRQTGSQRSSRWLSHSVLAMAAHSPASNQMPRQMGQRSRGKGFSSFTRARTRMPRQRGQKPGSTPAGHGVAPGGPTDAGPRGPAPPPCAGGGGVRGGGGGGGGIVGGLAGRFRGASLVGVDLEEPHLERARARCASFGSRVRFERGDALELHFGDAQFDLSVCRHLLQAVPDARRVLREMVRTLRPGGRLHLISEDYGMLWCHPTKLDSDGFWQRIPHLYGKAVGCDLYVGRKTFTYLAELGMSDIRADYVVADTLRAPRETFARIWEAWRDGYTDSIVEYTGIPRPAVEQRWREMIHSVRSPHRHALCTSPPC